jgi:hypothetical protein
MASGPEYRAALASATDEQRATVAAIMNGTVEVRAVRRQRRTYERPPQFSRDGRRLIPYCNGYKGW